MSNLAYAVPNRAPREVEEHQRHIEIVSTRNQRRARPRLVYALVAVGGLFVILMAQLLLSILLSNGAYQISALQTSQNELSRDQQTLTEALHVLESPQNLAGRAQQLGMVMNTSSSGWLRLSDGAVLQAPSAASAGSTIGTNDSALIPNVLLTPDVLALGIVQPGATAGTITPPSAGAPSTTTTGGSVASDAGVLPSPITH
jgi:hypothetical protein